MGCVPSAVVTVMEGVPAQGVYLPMGYLPGGVPAQWMYLPGGVSTWGGYLPRGVPAKGVYLPGGVPAQGTCLGGVCQHALNNSTIHKAAGLPATVQNDLWTLLCTAIPHRHFSILQGTAGN